MPARFQWLRDLALGPGLGSSFRLGFGCAVFMMLCCFWLRFAGFDDWFTASLLLLLFLALELGIQRLSAPTVHRCGSHSPSGFDLVLIRVVLLAASGLLAFFAVAVTGVGVSVVPAAILVFAGVLVLRTVFSECRFWLDRRLSDRCHWCRGR